MLLAGFRHTTNKFLFQYRNCEYATTNISPTVALLGHRLRGRLDALRPNIQSAVQDAQSKQKGLRNVRHTQFEVGEPVLVRNFSPKGEKWLEAHISAKTGPISYKVSSSSGVELRRHLDQILPVKDKSRYSLSRTSEGYSDKTENDVEASCDVEVPGDSRRESEDEEAVENDLQLELPITVQIERYSITLSLYFL
ncbi:unnamed protein product [Euphydryas editha]|uniref:Uncharacterized protein n=1 Tax=Euphydryas editha TaxID=104508 RepID=A0AAU9VAP2_EUPED|nr:unnamed protein product [Euphydryas editha]